MPAPTCTSGGGVQPMDPVQARLMSLPPFVRSLLAGGIAGGVAKTCVAPLERTKILFQTRGPQVLSVRDTLLYIWRAEGVHGLFVGNGASCLRIVPYAAIHFGAYENFKGALLSLPASTTSSMPQGGAKSPLWDLLAGSLSGATAVICTYPLDLVRTRLAWHTEGGASAQQSHKVSKHATIRSVLHRTYMEEGLRGLYRGATPTLLGILPYSGLKFYAYQTLKHEYWAWASNNAAAPAAGHVIEPSTPVARHQRLPLPLALTFGGISGVIAQTVTYPLDVIRRRMQVEGMQQLHAAECGPPPCSSGRAAMPTLPQPTAAAMASSSMEQQPQRRYATSSSHADMNSNSRQCQGAASTSTASSTTIGPASSLRRLRALDKLRAEHGRLQRVPFSTAAPSVRLNRLSMAQTTRLILAEPGGWRGLFRGLSINYMKVVPSTAIGFTVYDWAKSYLGVDSSFM